MALLTPVQKTINGADAAKAAADVAGETFRPGALTFLVANGGASPITVTVVVPGNTKYAQANPDVAVSVPASGERAIGPFPADLADPATGLVNVTYSGVTSVTRILLRD